MRTLLRRSSKRETGLFSEMRDDRSSEITHTYPRAGDNDASRHFTEQGGRLKKETRAKSGRIMPSSEHAKDALPRDTHVRDNHRPSRMSFMERDEAPSIVSSARVALGRWKSRPDGERLYFRQSR